MLQRGNSSYAACSMLTVAADSRREIRHSSTSCFRVDVLALSRGHRLEYMRHRTRLCSWKWTCRFTLRIIAATLLLLLFSRLGRCRTRLCDIPDTPAPTSEDHIANEIQCFRRGGTRSGRAFSTLPIRCRHIHLRISEVDQEKMRAALPECIYVPAELRWNNETVKSSRSAIQRQQFSQSQTRNTNAVT